MAKLEAQAKQQLTTAKPANA